MEILYLCSGRSFLSRSPGRKIGGVVDCWGQNGHSVHNLCGGDIIDNDTITSIYSSQQYRIHWYRKIPVIKSIIISLSEWRDIKHDRKMQDHLNTCTKFHPSIVWERSSRLHCAGLDYARQVCVPYVLEWKDHLVDYRFSLFRHKALRIESRKIREADYIVVESDVLKNMLASEGADYDKILVAHNAVDVTEFSKSETKRKKIRSELGIGDDVVLAGYLGSYAFYHDASRLVQATKLIAEQQLDRQVKVLMVGAGKEYPESRALAEKLDVLDKTLLMLPGVPKDQVPGILSALDIAVLPGSTDIICPIKVQEYMASQLPTVAPDYACNREVLQDGVTGELFAPKDAESLANKIILLAKDDALRLRMGHAARKDAAERFSWQATWGSALTRILEETAR